MRHPEQSKSLKRQQRRHQARKHEQHSSYIEARRVREER